MLQSVYIENIALIKRLSFEPGAGFCAFTGETGAGKSIIVDSLGLLCGARSDRELIRTGEDEALVEGMFYVNDAPTLKALAENETEPDEDGSITVTRRIGRDGRSVAKINGRNVPLSRLRAVASLLMSIHGQQDTQAFADTARQRMMLDSFAGNGAELGEYARRYADYRATEAKINALSEDERERETRLDMLKYRVNELESAAVYKGEKAELEAERRLLANSEKIISRCGAAYDALYLREGSAAEQIKEAADGIASLSGIIPEADGLSERLENAKYEIMDIADALKEYTGSDGEDTAARLDEVETRLETIKRLELKYRAEADGFAELLDSWKSELEAFENRDEELAKLNELIAKQKKALAAAAKELTLTRAAAAKKLCGRVTEELCALDMPAVVFRVELRRKDFAPDGADECEFMISANKGEEPRPMAKIASGGELSRIMLCLKCVFTDTESIGTLIFDEIDSGISGSTSEKIGIRLKKAAGGGRTQVICVTHSAILASRADHHYKISKSERNGRTETRVEALDRDGRRNELARIIGGLDITEAVLKTADELLERCSAD